MDASAAFAFAAATVTVPWRADIKKFSQIPFVGRHYAVLSDPNCLHKLGVHRCGPIHNVPVFETSKSVDIGLRLRRRVHVLRARIRAGRGRRLRRWAVACHGRRRHRRAAAVGKPDLRWEGRSGGFGPHWQRGGASSRGPGCRGGRDYGIGRLHASALIGRAVAAVIALREGCKVSKATESRTGRGFGCGSTQGLSYGLAQRQPAGERRLDLGVARDGGPREERNGVPTGRRVFGEATEPGNVDQRGDVVLPDVEDGLLQKAPSYDVLTPEGIHRLD